MEENEDNHLLPVLRPTTIQAWVPQNNQAVSLTNLPRPVFRYNFLVFFLEDSKEILLGPKPLF